MTAPSLSSTTSDPALNSASEIAPDRQPGTAAPLRVCRLLFAALDRAGVRYCHWKSNEHLLPGLVGETDLDLLVERCGSAQLQRALAEHDFKSFRATACTSYPGVEDYLGVDPHTGKMIHLHLHYQLVLGQQGLKGYRLPLETELLDGRLLDPQTGIYICAPHFELMLLLLRLALKLRPRDRVRRLVGRRCAGTNTQAEYQWLLRRTTTDTTTALSAIHLGSRTEGPVRELLDQGISFGGLYRLRAAARSVIDHYATYRPLAAAYQLASRRISRGFGALKNQVLATPEPLRRSSPRGGSLIAIIGADGAGKSTVIREVRNWLGWKLDVKTVYFGSGDGPISRSRRFLNLVVKTGARAKRVAGRAWHKTDELPPESPDGVDPHRATKSTCLGRLLRSIRVILIALERRRNLAIARRARNRGLAVITDRYPQTQFLDMMDSPHLSAWHQHQSRLLRAMARWEAAVYQSANSPAPDLVIKLCVDPDVARNRKQDQTAESLSRRCQIVHQLEFPTATETVAIDANRPLDRVLVEVKCAIWKTL